MQERELEDLMAKMRAATPAPSGALLARIEADAVAAQPRARPRSPAADRPPGLLEAWFALVGGKTAAAGLALAALTGVWLGFSQPGPVALITEGVSAGLGRDGTIEFVELIPGFDPLATEG